MSEVRVEREMAKRRAAIRPINKRIAKLREESISSPVKISSERARLVTSFTKVDKQTASLNP